MNQITPPALLELSLEEAIALISKAEALPHATRTQWSCSLRQIGRWLDRPLSLIPARWTALRLPIERLHHAPLGLSVQTFRNHKANLKAALRFLRGETNVPVRGTPLTPVCAALRDEIEHRGRRARVYGLMRYVSAKDIAPEQITDDVLRMYLAYRTETTARLGGPAAHRSTARAWNECHEQIPGWPAVHLSMPALPSRLIGSTWDEFRRGLRDDVRAYLDGLAGIRQAASGKRLRPAKASTIATRRREIEAFARRAIRIGLPLEHLTSLRALLDPDVVERILDDYGQEAGGTPSTYMIELAWKALSIARHVGGFDDLALERLDEMRFQLEEHRSERMTEFNLALVHEVLSGPIWDEVIRTPYRMIEEARSLRDYAPVKAAVRAQLAVAVGLLTAAPVRCGNLVRIRLEHNLIRPGGPGTRYVLTFPKYDVKNRVKLEFKLSERLTALIDEYLHDHQPVLLRGHNELWLFPGETGSFKTPSMFSEQITRAVETATGLRVRTHQFRHAAAALILKREPGNYEFVRRILGHNSLKTTTKFYIGLESFTATERFGELVDSHLDDEEE
ncbi:site-specific integrase [Microvirga sp. BT689]|uniref:tyrosine-type recombinase/integrase n=1 Tax=Microvirga arvi TaxID=2778731 RepID=UPI00194EFF11|nr:tyrosine-type recombinase/integrase [Microvirga arvi]MBM6582197.1 site-specific integrase [Microvirga arvi]